MKFFCKGLVCGLVTGMITGAIVVSKNKNLSSKIKEKTEIAERKIADFSSKVKQVFAKNEKKKKEEISACLNDNNCHPFGENNFVTNQNGQNCNCYNNSQSCN